MVRSAIATVVVLFVGYYVAVKVYWLNLHHSPDIPWALPAMLTMIILAARALERSPNFGAEKGVRNGRAAQVTLEGIVALLGVALALIIYLSAIRVSFSPLVIPTIVPAWTYWIYVIVIASGTSAPEELAFRGILLGAWMRRSSNRVALFGSTLLFVLWHVGEPQFISLIPMYFMLGLVFGRLYVLTHSVRVCLLLHFIWNFAALALPIATAHFKPPTWPGYAALTLLTLVTIFLSRNFWTASSSNSQAIPVGHGR